MALPRILPAALLSVLFLTAPGPVSAASVPVFASGSDTGISNSDNITSTTTPTFSGTYADGTTKIRIYVDLPADSPDYQKIFPTTSVSFRTWTFSGGAWSFTYPTPFTDGVHTVAIEEQETQSKTGAFTFTVDATAPVVTLSGDATVTVANGILYTDAGASASDTLDGPITPSVASSTVNTATAGTYEVSYSASDTAGNVGTTTRTVIVEAPLPDTVGPVITLVGAAAMTIEQGSTFLDPGASATDALEGVVSVTIGGHTVNTSVLGTYTITYNAQDSLGNAASQVTRTVEVVIVPVVPVVESSSSGGGGGGSRRSSASRLIRAESIGGEVLGASTYNFTIELAPGMSGPDVRALQDLLKAEGFFAEAVTGFYGTMTYEGVQKYQAKHGLPAIGRVGPQTLALLNRGSLQGSNSVDDAARLQQLKELLVLLQKLQILLLEAQAAGR